MKRKQTQTHLTPIQFQDPILALHDGHASLPSLELTKPEEEEATIHCIGSTYIAPQMPSPPLGRFGSPCSTSFRVEASTKLHFLQCSVRRGALSCGMPMIAAVPVFLRSFATTIVRN